MPSSTSSSSASRAPQGPWLRVWGLTLLATLLTLGAWEGFWRARGFTPCVDDSDALWGLEYLRLEPDSFVLTGLSHLRSDLDTETLRQELGRAPIRLGLSGTPPLEVLQALAQETSFKGTVLVEVNARYSFSFAGESIRTQSSLAAARRAAASPSFRLETQLSALSQELLLLRGTNLSLRRLWLLRNEPRILPSRWCVSADRSLRGDLRSEGLSPHQTGLRNLAQGPAKITPLDAEAQAKLVAAYRAAVTAIKARGGHVILVRLPTTGGIRDRERADVPRADYWEPLVRALGVPAIHFEDHPSLQGFEQADGGHMDARDSPRFTRALFEILRERAPEAFPAH